MTMPFVENDILFDDKHDTGDKQDVDELHELDEMIELEKQSIFLDHLKIWAINYQVKQNALNVKIIKAI